jgi:serine/threonine protein kinase
MFASASQSTETRLVGRYEILREIGRGGMAIVYAARQLELERQVALKELSRVHAGSTEFAQRFLRESRLAGSLNHPNIVTVHEYFEHGGVPYIAMEYVPRGSLRPYMRRLSLAQVAGVLEGVLAGLAHAETAGIVHRDLKPENIMVTADGRVKLTDFGIARATQRAGTQHMTATGMTVGTPTYMAPEQAMGKEVGPWTDLYSLGVLVYELFVGKAPFHDTDTPVVVLMRHVNEPIPSPIEMCPSLDPGLSRWIDALLAKDPSERTRRATDAWDALEEIIVRLLGPLWRRDARVLEDPSAVLKADPLTPAPFESQQAMQTPKPESRDVFVTFNPREGVRPEPPEHAVSEPEQVAASEPEHPEPDHEHEHSESDHQPEYTEPERELEQLEPDEEPELAESDEEPEQTEPDEEPKQTEPDEEPEQTEPDEEPEQTQPEEEPEQAEPEQQPDHLEPDPAPELAAPTARAAPHHGVRIAVFAATLTIAAVASGFILARSSSRPRATHASLTQTASAGSISISYPPDWRRTTAGEPGSESLGLSEPITLTPRRAGGSLIVGITRSTNPALLPTALMSRLSTPPPGANVRLGSYVYRRYLDVLPQGSSAPENVYALATTSGAVIAVCAAGTANAPAFAATCERSVASLRIASTSILPLSGNPTFANRLSAIVRQLSAARAAANSKLLAASRPAEQAAAAGALARAHRDAATAAGALESGPAGAGAKMAIATALGQLADAYSSLAAAAARSDKSRYNAARQAVARSDSALADAFAQLRRDGYSVG